MNPATRLVHGAHREDPYSASAPPLYQTATFAQSRSDAFDEFDYTRTDNPTRRWLEAELAQLERGHGALAYASGMAAVAAALRRVAPGERLLVGDDLYGGTERFLALRESEGVIVERVDTTRPEEVRVALPGARMLYLETPSNPRMEVSDLAALGRLCRRSGTKLVVDNTMLSPWIQQPIELGADLVIQSCTKHLSGHSDLVAGAIIARSPEDLEALAFERNASGTALAPFDSWLLLRGMKTLGVRMERAQATARTLAEKLAAHPKVTRVRYPGVGSVLGFETGDRKLSEALVEQTKLFSIAVSFGGVASSISLPCAMSHASVPTERQRKAPLPPDLVRLAVGLEDGLDLWADLARVFDGLPGRLGVERAHEAVRLHGE